MAKNSQRITRQTDKIISYTSRELLKSYNAALKDVRAELSRLYEIYRAEGELTKAQATQFLRKSNIEAEIVRVMEPYLAANEQLLKEVSEVSFNRSFFGNAWAVEQAVGVDLKWGLLSDNAVRAAIGLSDDYASLEGLMSASEVKKHASIIDKAFKNYSIDSRKWIGREVSQAVIKGESVSKVAKRLKKSGIAKSYNSAMRIARTEVLRSTGLGGQIAYDDALDKGVRIKQVWDATLDENTRPDHAELDGAVMENGVFSTAAGDIPGPRRSGDPAFDINCRCTVRPEVDGFSPEVRRIRGEGIQPYKTFKEWAADKGTLKNKYGQKYNFLD